MGVNYKNLKALLLLGVNAEPRIDYAASAKSPSANAIASSKVQVESSTFAFIFLIGN
jgi:hypothetical protein